MPGPPTPYPGYAPLTVTLVGPAAPGVMFSTGAGDPHGAWPTTLECTGAQDRSGANLMAGVESLTSRTNKLGWMAIDYSNGGDYTGWTSEVTLGSEMIWKGQHDFFGLTFWHANATIASGFSIIVPSGGHIAVASGGDVTANAGAMIQATGASSKIQATNGGKLYVDETGTALFDGGATFTDETVYSGAGAYRVLREVVVSANAPGFAAEAWDIVACFQGTGAYTITLTDPAALPNGICTKFYVPGNGNTVTVTIKSHLGTVIGVMTAAVNLEPLWITFKTGSIGGPIIWIPIDYGDPANVVTTTAA